VETLKSECISLLQDLTNFLVINVFHTEY